MTQINSDSIATPVFPESSKFTPLALGSVELMAGFWSTRQRINTEFTIPHVVKRLESEGWLPNFDLAAQGTVVGNRRGPQFADSEVYKFLEALAWEVGRAYSAGYNSLFQEVSERVSAAQEPDGYLHTLYGREGQQPRWSELEWGHELYCLGHLFQAAVARVRTGFGENDVLVETARKAADLVCVTFGADGIQSICGHPEIELGLVEFGRALSEPRYIEQARLFVERRGRGSLREHKWGRAYNQDDVPVREATSGRGHAVRYNYFTAGAIDVAVATSDECLFDSLRKQWQRTISRRTFITGGQGSRHQDEGYGLDWELTPDRAYSETCAGIASIMVSWRLLLQTGEAQYADLIERTLFNVIATSTDRTGTRFFYANPLQVREPGIVPDPSSTSPRAEASLRAPWFEISCCPPNIARTFASLNSLFATASAGGVQIHQFAGSRINTILGTGAKLELLVETNYPEDGTVTVHIVDAPATEVELSIRVPGWARDSELLVKLGDESSTQAVSPGYTSTVAKFVKGDKLELSLNLTPRVSLPDPRVDSQRGSAAIERGPIVYALESVDLPEGTDFDAIEIPATASIEYVSGRLLIEGVSRSIAENDWPYTPHPALVRQDQPLVLPLVPYFDWANKGPTKMRVFIPFTSTKEHSIV